MSKSLGNSLLIPAVLERVRGIELRFYIVAAHYRSHVEFSFEALDEAAAGFRRIENFLDRAAAIGIGHDERPTTTARASKWIVRSAIRLTSCCGNPRSPASPPGLRRGATAARAGTSSARP
jgi:cysteinyl-tRNA synthetase